jgi:predicted RNA-binding protein associated with RNAse of E/G family
MTSWTAGDTVAVRGVWRGKLWSAAPALVVRDEPDLLALYMPHGTLCVFPRDSAGNTFPMERRLNMDWQLRTHSWKNHMLKLVVPGASHSVWLLWKENWEQICWYINLETPTTRTPLGFEYFDEELDVVVSPDMSEWRWKDEDDFQRAQELGLVSAERASKLRAEGKAAIERLLARAAPFDRDWEKWRPDPAWPVPELAPGWDAVA